MKISFYIYGTAKGIMILITCVMCYSSCINILGETENKTECLIVTPDANRIEIRKVLSGATSPNYILVLYNDSVVERVNIDNPIIKEVHINNDSIVITYAEHKYIDKLGEDKHFRCKLNGVFTQSSFNFHYVNRDEPETR